jgi:hypothetical protein
MSSSQPRVDWLRWHFLAKFIRWQAILSDQNLEHEFCAKLSCAKPGSFRFFNSFTWNLRFQKEIIQKQTDESA